MRRNVSSDSSTFHVAPVEGRSYGALLASLLLLTVSFVLLVLGPMLLARFQGASASLPASGFLSMAAASGIALGGGAAMIAVVSRLVRDIELRPYAGLAPVLGVFAGFVLWGLRAQLPLQGVASEYVGVFALMVAVAGGALVAQRSGMARFAGWSLSFFAPLTLAGLVWAYSGKAQIDAAYASLTPQQKTFVGLLFACSFAMAVLGEATRALVGKRAAEPAYSTSTQTFGAVQRQPLFADAFADAPPAAAPVARSYPPVPVARSSDPGFPRLNVSTDARFNAMRGIGAATEDHFAEQYAAHADDSAPKLNVWDMHEDLELPKRFAWWKVLLVALLVLGGGGAGLYYGVMLPQQQRELAAKQLIEQKQQEIRAADLQKEQALRAKEAAEAAARLEQMLTKPAAPATAADVPSEPAPTQAAQPAAP